VSALDAASSSWRIAPSPRLRTARGQTGMRSNRLGESDAGGIESGGITYDLPIA